MLLSKHDVKVSRRLAELLGGTISVESEVGSGSTFVVRLPLRLGESQPEPAHQSQRSTTGPRVLFIEDNRETSFVHETSLKATNYRLAFAHNIPEARAAMRTAMPDIVSLDRFIDGEDSLYYIGELRNSGYSGPIIVISVIDDEQAAIGSGANAFLTKPVAPFRLQNALRELLEGETSNAVLLADDDEVSRYLLGEALTKLGYKVVEATNGGEAIQIMENHILSGVFLDIIMPDLTGFEVLREIRSNPFARDVRIIVHTSKDLSPQEQDEIADLGALIYPKREFSSHEGAETLREVLAAAGIGQ
jgi:CheY-like chemotaxis protein